MYKGSTTSMEAHSSSLARGSIKRWRNFWKFSLHVDIFVSVLQITSFVAFLASPENLPAEPSQVRPWPEECVPNTAAWGALYQELGAPHGTGERTSNSGEIGKDALEESYKEVCPMWQICRSAPGQVSTGWSSLMEAASSPLCLWDADCLPSSLGGKKCDRLQSTQGSRVYLSDVLQDVSGEVF